MQFGDHGVHSVCAVAAVEVATGSPPGYASKQSVAERITVKANTKDTYLAMRNVVQVSTAINSSPSSIIIYALYRATILGRLAGMV